MVRKLGLYMINMQTKFEVSMFTHHEDMKGNAKCRNRDGFKVRGHPRSTTISPFNRAPTTAYSTLTETMHLSCTDFEL